MDPIAAEAAAQWHDEQARRKREQEAKHIANAYGRIEAFRYALMHEDCAKRLRALKPEIGQ